MHIDKSLLTCHVNNCFGRKTLHKARENISGIMFALSLSSLHFWHPLQPPEWQVALYQTMSRLEPQVNNWHRHDPWRTMHGLLHQSLFLFTRRATQSDVPPAQEVSVSLSVPKYVLTAFANIWMDYVSLQWLLRFFQALRRDRCVFSLYLSNPTHWWLNGDKATWRNVSRIPAPLKLNETPNWH